MAAAQHWCRACGTLGTHGHESGGYRWTNHQRTDAADKAAGTAVAAEKMVELGPVVSAPRMAPVMEPAQHVAVVACMDARLNIYAVLGLKEVEVTRRR
ncbi:hypothetical protein [Streptomyces sioyaensis]|uniref:hypothetical protein n=1 Tax=Streptomyces sioyaensis TaxID=67364 RepID=UPI0037A95B4B